MNITVERNKEARRILNSIFGHENVIVRSGRGTAASWTDVIINAGHRISTDEFYTQQECRIVNSLESKAIDAIKHLDFPQHNGDEMINITVRLNTSPAPVEQYHDSGRELRRQIRMNKAAESNWRNAQRTGRPLYY